MAERERKRDSVTKDTPKILARKSTLSNDHINTSSYNKGVKMPMSANTHYQHAENKTKDDYLQLGVTESLPTTLNLMINVCIVRKCRNDKNGQLSVAVTRGEVSKRANE